MYAVARRSTVRMIVDMIETLGEGIEYYDWDAHAEGFVLPEKDLIGIVGFSCVRDAPFHDITFGIGIMVINDPNLSRAVRYADAFYKRLGQYQTFPLYNDDGTTSSFEAICFDGVSAAPMSRVDARPTTEILASARLTEAGQKSLP